MAYLSWAVIVVPLLWVVYFVHFVLEPILRKCGVERADTFWGLKDLVKDYQNCCDILERRGDTKHLRSLRFQARVFIGILFTSVVLRLVL